MPDAAPLTAKKAFERRCYLNGVTEVEVVARLWAAEQARRTKATADAKAAARKPRSRKPPVKKGRT